MTYGTWYAAAREGDVTCPLPLMLVMLSCVMLSCVYVYVMYPFSLLQMLNLTHDWLRSFLPHVLAKIDRVSFGLLTPADLKRALQVTDHRPKNRNRFGVAWCSVR